MDVQRAAGWGTATVAGTRTITMESRTPESLWGLRGILPVVACLAGLLLPGPAHALTRHPQTPPSPERWWIDTGEKTTPSLAARPLTLLRYSAVPVQKTATLDFENRRMEFVWTGGEVELFRWTVPLAEYVRVTGRQRATRTWDEAKRTNLGKGLEEAERGGVSIDIPVQFPRQVEAIIGQGANLDVSGSETISFRGESSYLVDAPETEYGRQSKFPQLDMKQRLRVNLDGTIGEKIHVLVNHDSEVQSALENRIKLRYEGREDEIIQNIEMGNTDLSITGAQFVSYRGTHQGLFGAKMLAQVGALDMAVIASKKEGKSARSTFVGRASKDSVIIYDIEYQKRKYYTLRRSEDPHRLRFPAGALDIPTQVTIWVDDHDVANNKETGAVPGYAYLAAPSEEALIDSVRTPLGFFDRLTETQDYYIDPGSGMVTFYQPLRPEYTVAVSYVDSSGLQLGNAPPAEDVPDTLRLKMLKPRKDDIQTERWAYTRGYEFKHFYFLGSRNILPDDFELEIRRQRTGAETHDPDRQGEEGLFIEVLGVDTRDNLSTDPESEPDGKVDPEWVDYTLGVLQFPDLRPFDPDTTRYALEQLNPGMYDVYEEKLMQRPQDYRRYYLVAKYRTPQTSYSLNQVNIIEASEKVILNGRQLQRGRDYQIIYEIGQVDLMGEAAEEAQKPDANISIDFEYAPFLAMAQQSLLGVSGQYALSERNNLGFAWLYESKSTPEDRPRLGQEPSRYQVGDFNARLEFNPDLMTRMVDVLPFVRADAQSSLKISGEVAASFPNPNTKDEVYIDDMEGIEDARILSIARRGWVPASPPPGRESHPHLRFNWYNPRNKVKAGEVFPNLASEQERDEPLTILELDAQSEGQTLDWIGLMRLISKSGTDLSESKFFQIRFNDRGFHQGKIHIDLGSINEDFYRPEEDLLNTEDTNFDGILDYWEDTGLDTLNTGEAGDDPDDDYHYEFSNQDDYSRINGTEGNQFLDTEDLDRDGSLGVDAYFSIEVDLGGADYDVTPEELTSTWRLFQIPLADFSVAAGDPMWESIRYARIWFEDLGAWNEFQIASMEVIGNRWVERGVRSVVTGDSIPPAQLLDDEYFTLKVVNNKENIEYDPPFDPGEERDTGAVAKRGQREQSLAFVFEDLDLGHMVSARKEIHEVRGNPQINDYTRYGSLEFWLKAFRMSNPDQQPVFFVRLATAPNDFYEYRVRLTGGWRTIKINLEDLPRVKLQPDTTTIIYEGRQIVAVNHPLDGQPLGEAQALYAVYGQPSLTKVVEITAGIMNDRGEPLSGEVWFNEIRLKEVKKDVGMARRVTASAQFSDVLSVSGDLRQIDGDFASLGKQRSGRNQTDYSVDGRVEAGKLVESLGLKIPVSVSYSRSEVLPQLVTGSDIVLDAEGAQRERSESTGRGLGVSFARSRSSENPLIHLLVDGWSVSATRKEQRSSSPVRRDYSENVSASASYRWTTQRQGFRFFRNMELAYLPKAVRFSIDGQRRTEQSFDVFDNRTREELRYDRVVRTASGSGEFNVSPLQSETLSSDFTFSMHRDLLPDKKKGFREGLGFGNEVRRNHSTKLTYKPTILSFLSPAFTYDTSYQEDQSPSIRQASDPEGTRKANAQSTIRWTFNVKMAEIRRAIFGDRKPQRGGGRRAQPQREASEEGESPEEEEGDTGGEEEAGDGGPGLWWMPLDLVTSRVQQLNATFSIQRGSVYERIPERPSLIYQFGLASGVPKDLADRSLSKGRDSRNERRSTSLTGTVNPLADIGITTKYQSSQDTRWVAAGARQSNSRTWPDLSWSYDGLDQFDFVRRYVSRASLQSSYLRRRDWSGPLGREEQSSRRVEWSPLLSINATVKGGVTSTLSVGRSTDESEQRVGARVRTRTVNSSYQLSLKYSFTLPEGVGMPLDRLAGRSGRSREGGKVSLNIDMSYSTNKSENLTTGDVTSQGTRLSVIPKATYTFSRNMNGNLNAKFAQDSDKKRGRTTRSIGLGVELMIRF